MNTKDAMIIRAKYIVPNSKKSIDNGAICINGPEIIDIGNYPSVAHRNVGKLYDLGDVMILPGLINAHVHLELTNLYGQLRRTNRLSEWLLEVIKSYRHIPHFLNRAFRFLFGKSWTEKWLEKSVSKGISMSLAGGVTTLADITVSGCSTAVLKKSPIRKIIFYETLGFDGKTGQQKIINMLEKLDQWEDDALLTKGISPHAPYDTSAALYQKCLQYASDRGLPLCTHLAETESEIEFLMAGTGEFRNFFNELGISPEDWEPPEMTPVQYMHELGILEYAPLLIHCNYLTESDMHLLQDSNASVVFCPRSHAYFYHRNHPFKKLIEYGVNVVLGTDSLASNQSLSMLDEMKFLRQSANQIQPEILLEMATINGAKALKLITKVGALHPGWQADMIALDIPDGKERLLERAFSDESHNVYTMVAGNVCYSELEF